MDWTALTIVIPVARWAKKQFDISAREKRVSQREQDLATREKQLDELIELRDHNINMLPDYIFLQVERVDYRIGQITQVAEIQFTVTNRSIFDVTLHKFTANPHFQGQKLAKLQDVEERLVAKQSGTSFTVICDLPESAVKLIESLEQVKSKTLWGFEMRSYFRSEIKNFDKSQTDSITI